MAYKVLIIEDEQRLARILGLVLKDNGYEVKTCENGEKGIETWIRWEPDIVLTDVKMTPVDGMEVLKFGRLNFPQIPVVILTAFGSIEMAVGAMKKGAFDFLAKPVDHGQLLEVVRQALAGTRKKKRNLRELLGSSMVMNRVKKDIQLFAQTDFSVLIRGESGTGKELAAR
ncbi:MAG: response regulator, partial [Desulfobacterales bacterium]|nr:response regulator [Desulfobacterales bacterium]